jgi:uncharacterized phage infection (PIP) family protein YhgE
MDKKIEIIQGPENLQEQVSSLLEFGRQNNGWSSLLELEEVENTVFQVETSWREVEPLMTEKDTLDNEDIKSAIKIINDSYAELRDLTRGIKDVLQNLKNSKSTEVIKKADAGVALRMLQAQDNLTDFPAETQGDITSLVALMQEFQSLYTKWANSKDSFEKLLEYLEKYNQNTRQGQDKVQSNFPSGRRTLLKGKKIVSGGGYGTNRKK